MRRGYQFLLRWRSLICRPTVDYELDKELVFIWEQQIEENLAAGMSPGEARYAARRTVGGIEQRGVPGYAPSHLCREYVAGSPLRGSTSPL
jgi:hypothetical protein